MEDRTFRTLDALRGIAAICVVLWHADWLVAPLRPQHGDLAVDLFFVMSGFVIAHAYEAKLRAGMSAGEFTLLRFIRLYPLYALGSTIGLGAGLIGLGASFDPASVAWTTAMLPTPSLARGASLYPYDGVAWSLLLEIAINIVFAFTWRFWTIRNLLIALAISGGLVVAATLAHGDANFGWTWRNLPGGAARVCFGFPMGVLIYRLFTLGRLPRGPGAAIVLLAGCVLLYWRPASIGLAVDILGLLIGAPTIVALAVMREPSTRGGRLAISVGAASYAVYALHLPLLEALRNAGLRDVLEPWSPLPGLAFLSVVVALALVANAMFDAPARAWLVRWMLAAKRVVPAQPVREP